MVVRSTFAARATLAIPSPTTAASTDLQIERRSLVANAPARAPWWVRLDDVVGGVGARMSMLTIGAPLSVADVGRGQKGRYSASQSNFARPNIESGNPTRVAGAHGSAHRESVSTLPTHFPSFKASSACYRRVLEPNQQDLSISHRRRRTATICGDLVCTLVCARRL